MPTIFKVAWLLVENRRVLFARSRKEKERFYCVGGKIKEGEGKIAALYREVEEETSVRLHLCSVEKLHTFHGEADGHPGVPLEIICYKAGYIGQPVPSGEVAELAWFTTSDMRRTTEVGKQILRWLHDQRLID